MDRDFSQIIDDGHECQFRSKYEELLFLFESSNIDEYRNEIQKLIVLNGELEGQIKGLKRDQQKQKDDYEAKIHEIKTEYENKITQLESRPSLMSLATNQQQFQGNYETSTSRQAPFEQAKGYHSSAAPQEDNIRVSLDKPPLTARKHHQPWTPKANKKEPEKIDEEDDDDGQFEEEEEKQSQPSFLRSISVTQSPLKRQNTKYLAESLKPIISTNSHGLMFSKFTIVGLGSDDTEEVVDTLHMAQEQAVQSMMSEGIRPKYQSSSQLKYISGPRQSQNQTKITRMDPLGNNSIDVQESSESSNEDQFVGEEELKQESFVMYESRPTVLPDSSSRSYHAFSQGGQSPVITHIKSAPVIELNSPAKKHSPGSKDDSFTDSNKIEFNDNDIRERVGTHPNTDPNRSSLLDDAANVTPNDDEGVDSEKMRTKEPHNEQIKTGSRSFILDSDEIQVLQSKLSQKMDSPAQQVDKKLLTPQKEHIHQSLSAVQGYNMDKEEGLVVKRSNTTAMQAQKDGFLSNNNQFKEYLDSKQTKETIEKFMNLFRPSFVKKAVVGTDLPLQQPSLVKRASGDFTNDNSDDVHINMTVHNTKIKQATKGRDFPTPRPSSPNMELFNRVTAAASELKKFGSPVPNSLKKLYQSSGAGQSQDFGYKRISEQRSMTPSPAMTEAGRRPPSQSVQYTSYDQGIADFILDTKPNKPSKFSQISEKFFEYFFIVGVDSQVFDQVDHQTNIVDYQFGPQVLFQYPPKASDLEERGQMIKDFVFPEGVHLRKIQFDLKDQHELEFVRSVIHEQKAWRKTTYIFTQDGNEEMNGQSGDNYWNCMCIQFEDFMERPSDKAVFLTKRAYCMMFRNNYYELHSEIMASLLHVLKLEQYELKDNSESHLNFEQQLIEAMIKTPVVPARVENTLNKYFAEHYDPSQFPLSQIIEIKSDDFVDVVYQFPSHQEDFLHAEYHWFCPTLFSMFKAADFQRLLTAIMLERSLIFVSNNITFLSNTVLGFKTIIKPFQWCYSLVPIMPRILLGYLDTPQPLLAGVIENDLKETDLTDEDFACKTWVFLDSYTIKWSKYDQDIKKSTEKDLLSWLSRYRKETQEAYKLLFKQALDGNRISRMELSDTFLESVVIVPTDQQKEAILKISKEILECIRSSVLNYLPLTPVMRRIKHGHPDTTVDISRLQEDIMDRCDLKDRLFLEQFLQTQMFVQLVEDCYNPKVMLGEI